MVETEAEGRLDAYGKSHRGYCFFEFRYMNTLDPEVLAAPMRPIGEKPQNTLSSFYKLEKDKGQIERDSLKVGFAPLNSGFFPVAGT